MAISAGIFRSAEQYWPHLPAYIHTRQKTWPVASRPPEHIIQQHLADKPPGDSPILMSCSNFTMNCGTGHYVELMRRFDAVIRVFLTLDPAFQDAIVDGTKRMGDGMAEFIEKEVRCCRLSSHE